MAPARHGASRVARVAMILALAAACGALLTPDQAGEWQDYQQDLRGLTVGGQQASSTLQAVLSHDYSTPLNAVLAANAYTGGNARLRRVVADLQAGKPIKVLAVGGLATNGTGATKAQTSDFFSIYYTYLARAFPAATVKPVRASMGLAPSALVLSCADKYLPNDADLVLVEMAASDGAVMDSSIVNPTQPKAYEMLVRKIMGGSKQPAVVLVQAIPPGMGSGKLPFYMTPESPQYAAVAGYYNLPVISLRNALWSHGDLKPTGQMTSDDVIQADGSTPNDAGHAALADSLVFLTQRTAQDLQTLPFGDYDSKQLAGDLPKKPMLNLESGKILVNATCSWVRNATVSATGCPVDPKQLCGLDFSSWDSIRSGYLRVKPVEAEASEFSSDKGGAAGSRSPRGLSGNAIIAIAVVGAVLGLAAVITGVVVLAIIRRKRAMAEEEEAAYRSKFGASPSPSPLPVSSGDSDSDGSGGAAGASWSSPVAAAFKLVQERAQEFTLRLRPRRSSPGQPGTPKDATMTA